MCSNWHLHSPQNESKVLAGNRVCDVPDWCTQRQQALFKMYRDQLPDECFHLCEEEVACQSYNVVIGQNICELNNRTKEARPEDFISDQRRFYMKRSGNRGTFTFPRLTFWICVSGKTCFLNFSFMITENSDF